jgi:membrane-bound lytic murein transglycosylase MltF
MLLQSCGREAPDKAVPSTTAAADTAAAVASPPPAAPTAPAPADPAPPVPVTLPAGLARHWTGDLDGMIARGRIRVLVTLSRTNFFIDRGTQRGITHDRFAEYEKELNERLSKQGRKRVDIVFVPVVRDQLLPALIEGRGDIAAANLSITEKRLTEVDFSAPLRTSVNEVLVTGPGARPVASLADMAGREVFIRESSSFFESVRRVNDSLRKAGVKPIEVKKADERLEEEDILEMVNAGLVPATIVDDHVASFWSGVYDSMVVHPSVTFATGGKIAWAIRKRSPELRKSLDAFAVTHAKGTTFGNIMDKRYWKDAGYVTNPATKERLAQFRAMVDIFRKYGDRYGFDHLLLAAQGYQESGLDQSMRSRAGAIGVMQVTPRTASDPNVGIPGIDQLEPNIHAGSKYMRFILDRYFRDEPMDSLNRTLFAFASYNAGPARVAKLRAQAKEMGLNPNLWFNNVEVVAAQEIGRETVTYVRNIYKYYVAYVLASEQQAARRRALQQTGRKHK